MQSHYCGLWTELSLRPQLPSHYLDQFYFIVTLTYGNRFRWSLSQNTIVSIQENMIESVVCNMADTLVQYHIAVFFAILVGYFK